MNIFTWIISPLELLLRTLLDFFYVFTSNYGIAIVLLSVCVNIILLPIYLLAERLQDKEIAIKNTMRGKCEEIKRAFQGQERFMMTHTLYKIHSYHPVMGLRALGSLLIQILFFFTTYELLKNFQAFYGVSFLFIQDLSKPDALLSLGRLPINILPLIMTAINIVAAQIYARRKNPHALLSTWGMAFVFLLLLYQSSAALVLYWICNNIFTLIKNIILEYKTRSSHENLPSTYALIKERVVNWLEQDSKFINTIFFLWGLGAYFFLSYGLLVEDRLRDLIPHALLSISGIIFACTALLLLLKHALQHHNIRTALITGGYILLSLTGLVLLLYFITLPIQDINTRTIFLKLLGIFLVCSPNGLFLPMVYRLKFHRSAVLQSKALKKNQWYVVGLSILSIALLLFFALPIQMYVQNPSEIPIDFQLLVRSNFIFTGVFVAIFVGICVGAYLLSRLLSRNIVFYVGLGIVALSFMLLAYALLVPFDMGQMNNFTLIFPHRLSPPLFVYVIEGLGITAFIYYLISYFRKKPTILLIMHTIFIAILIFQITQSSIGASTLPNTLAQSQESDSLPQTSDLSPSENNIPQTAQSIFSFSRKHKNILVILLDMANGGYIQRIMKEDKEFVKNYQGFTWYPNSLSISTKTVSSLPSMLGGWKYTPGNIKNVEEENLQYKMNVAYDAFIDTFLTNNYEVAFTSTPYYYRSNCKGIRARGGLCLSREEHTQYVEYWISRNPQYQNDATDNIPIEAILVNISGLLRSVPIFLKQRIYNEGEWFFSAFFEMNAVYKVALPRWALIDSLDSVSTVKAQEDTRNTIKFIHTNITHDKYALNASCQLEKETYPDPKVDNPVYGDNAYNSLQCTLGSLTRLFHWMKEQEIYDNTKIIIVSDHGNSFTEDPMNTANIVPELFETSEDKRIFLFNRIHALFMIKEFDNREDMNTDDRFLSNADLSSIMFHSIDNYVPPPGSLADDKRDPTHTAPRSRTLPTYDTIFYPNDLQLQKEKETIPILTQYEVTDNIFVPENWKRILPK